MREMERITEEMKKGREEDGVEDRRKKEKKE